MYILLRFASTSCYHDDQFIFIIRFRQVSIKIFSYASASIFLLYAAASRLSFHSWSNAGWLIFFYQGCNIYTKYVNYNFLFILELCLNIGRTWTFIYYQVLKCVWCGDNCVDTCHEFVWIICFFCISSLFYIIQKFFQIIIIAFQNSKSFWGIVFLHPFRTF